MFGLFVRPAVVAFGHQPHSVVDRVHRRLDLVDIRT